MLGLKTKTKTVVFIRDANLTSNKSLRYLLLKYRIGSASNYQAALELQRLWVRNTPYACDFIHRSRESTEYTVLTNIGVG